MPKRCPDCQTRTSTPGRCPHCRAEHLATTADYVDDDVHACAWCSRSSAEGRYERLGMWLCDDCVRERIAAESTAVGTDLDRAVRWAVGDASAYPDSDPGECAFVSGNDPRLVADGGDR